MGSRPARTSLGSLGTAALLLSGTLAGAAPKSCEDVLASNLYRCHVKQESGVEFDNCSQFVSAGGLSSKFDLVIDGLFTFGCTCKATGKRKNAKFDASREFLCVSALNGEGIEGKVNGNGKRITAGFLGAQTGFSVVFECALDPACTPPQ